MTGPYVLTFSCGDAVGIVAAVTGLLAERDGFILDSQQYADLDTGRFFMRVAFRGAGPRFPDGLAEVQAAFAPVVERFAMDARISDSAVKPRFVIAVSQGSHCLNDLLHRWSTGNLAIDIAAVVSNHEHQRRLTEWHGVPFHHLPVSDANRASQE
ncbi:MAG: formyltetrahydrofolate deformylase, partial [Sphingopyxis sp.]